jgi:glycosyltransferase involved in cell wall biosynthesis
MKLTVIIPSRKQERQIAFIERAVDSVRRQTIAEKFAITFLVGVDQGCAINPGEAARLGITCVESSGASQAAALNAAIGMVEGDYVAFLEDDDQWMPDYLNFVTAAGTRAGFVSSTQMEFGENDVLQRINDFATPSGWFMPVATLRTVGGFDTSFRFHLDNEWLGRLGEAKINRVHLVEATAPMKMEYMLQVRPWLANVINLSAGCCQIVRHSAPYPLVRRLMHTKSGMALITGNRALQEISQEEYRRLGTRFGRVPW